MAAVDRLRVEHEVRERQGEQALDLGEQEHRAELFRQAAHGPLQVVFWLPASHAPGEIEPAFRAHFEYELQRLFYECAGSSFRESFAPLMELVTVRQMLFGSDYPWGRLSIQQTIDGLLKQGFSPAELRLIERENALGLFPRFR